MYTKHELCTIIASSETTEVKLAESFAQKLMSKSNQWLIDKLEKHGLKFEMVGNLFKPIYK